MSFSFETKSCWNRHNSRRKESRENWSNSRCKESSESDENNERVLTCRIIAFLDRIRFFDDEIFNWEIVIDYWCNCLSIRFFCIRRRMHDKNNQFFDVFIQLISRSIHRNREKILHDFHQMNVFDYFFYNLVVEKKFIIIIINDVIENKFIKFALISSCFQCFLHRSAFIIECLCFKFIVRMMILKQSKRRRTLFRRRKFDVLIRSI
jgi:hypothetical protein